MRCDSPNFYFDPDSLSLHGFYFLVENREKESRKQNQNAAPGSKHAESIRLFSVLVAPCLVQFDCRFAAGSFPYNSSN